MMRGLLWSGLCLLMLSKPLALMALGCDLGREAFKSEFFDFIRSSSVCVYCHGGQNESAPAWAVGDVDVSYRRVRSFVDFDDVSSSTIVIRAGNGHCGSGCQNESFQRELITRITQWWEKGESECERYQKSSEVIVPETVSSSGYSTMEFSLDSIGEVWRGYKFRIEIKALEGKEPGKLAAYIFRHPQMVFPNTVEKKVHISGIRIFINGHSFWYSNGFDGVDVTLDPPAHISIDAPRVSESLSNAKVTLEGGELGKDKLAVGFAKMELLSSE